MALGLTPYQIIEKGTHPQLVIADEWERIELKNIATVQNGFAFSSKLFSRTEGMPLIRIRDIFSSETENLYTGEFNEEFVVTKGDILIGMDGDFKVSKWSGNRGLLNQRVCRIHFESSHYEKEFLFICIQPYLNAIHSETSAVTVKHLSSRTINEIPFPLPPLPEQRAIVAKIEELFSSLDSGIADLIKAQEQLVVYRQAVLKKAFEGEYSNKEYRIVPIESLCEVVRGGSPRPAGDVRFYHGDIPFMKVKDISRNQGVFVNKAEHSIKEAGLKKTRLVSPYTLLLTNSGATLGIPAITTIKTTFNDGIAAFLNLDDNLLYHYYYWCGKTAFLRNLNQGAAQPNLNTTVIGKMEIPIYNDKSEHSKIVQEIESRLSICDALEQSIKESLDKSESLRQSILKKAFEGTLLTKEEIEKCKRAPDWEPASVLLERIKQEK